MRGLLCIFVLFLSFSIAGGYAQNTPELSIGFGAYGSSDKGGISSATGGQLNLFYPFFGKGDFKIGVSAGGDFNVSGKSPLIPFAPFETGNNVTSSVSISEDYKQKLLGWRVGPQFNYRPGGKFLISGMFHVGQLSMSMDEYRMTQNLKVETAHDAWEVSKEIYGRDVVKTASIGYMPKIRIGYALSRNVDLWAEGSIFMSKIDIKERYLDYPGEELSELENAHIITDKMIGFFQEAQTIERESKKNINIFNYQIGLNFNLGSGSKGKKKPKIAPEVAGTAVAATAATAIGINPLRKDPAKVKEEKEERERKRAIRLKFPENNSSFTPENQPQRLQWEIVDEKVLDPEFFVELTELNAKGKVIQTHHARTKSTSISVEELLKREVKEGKFRWRVNELTKGLGSDDSNYSLKSCISEFKVEIDTVICLEYEGENKKYKVYINSINGPGSDQLTFNDSGSGLFVYDSQFNQLSYTLVGNNTALVNPQAINTTVQYEAEITVPANETMIYVSIQGDDLNPLPTSNCIIGDDDSFELPDCICDECDEIESSFNVDQISNHNGHNNRYLLTGNINSNVPLYGVEIQVLSYDYESDPENCAVGVTQLEESGMFLRTGTAINGDSQVQFMNTSSNSNANPNASKVIKYLSNGAMNGNIPFDLVIGLPGAPDGFDASCCIIKYNVCFKVVVYYDDYTCKSCVFTECVQFSNQ